MNPNTSSAPQSASLLSRPLIPLVVCFMLGIWAGQRWPLRHADFAAISVGLAGVGALLSLRGLARLATWAVLGALIALGAEVSMRTFYPALPPEHLAMHLTGERQVMEGYLVSSPRLTPGGAYMVLEAERIGTEDRLVSCFGRVRLRVSDPGQGLPRSGDRIRVWVRLSRAVNYGNPGGFDYNRYLAVQGIHIIGFLPDASRLVTLASGCGPAWRLAIERARHAVRGMLEKTVKGDANPVLRALVIGESGEIPVDIRDRYVRAGVAHLLAISGLHLSGVAWMAYRSILFLLLRFEWLILRFNLRAAAAGFTIFPVLFYTLLAGARLPTQRAAVMVVTFLISIILKRERDLYSTMALAALVILMINPGSLFDASFQLSFTAVFGVIYFTPKIMEMLRRDDPLAQLEVYGVWRRVKRGVLYAAVASVAALLGITPLLAYHFNQVSLIGLATNVLLIPLVMFFILPTALLGLLIGPIWSSAAYAGLKAAGLGTLVLNHFVEVFSSVPGSFFWVATPAVWEIIVWYSALAIGAHWKKRSMRWVALILVATLGLGNGIGALAASWSPELRLTFLSVGRGDAALIEFPGGSAALVDGGGFQNRSFDIGRSVVAPALWSKGIRRLEWIVATHGHPDHVNGLFFILEAFSPSELWVPEGGTSVPLLADLIRAARNRNVRVKEVSRETQMIDMQGVRVRVLNPPKPPLAGFSIMDHRSINDNSIVLSLDYQGFRFLLAADVESQGEQALLAHPQEIWANVLKVPHHGSATSSGSDFVAAVSPAYAVFSADGRQMPAQGVMRRYSQLGAHILRTDQLGAIEVAVNGGRIKVRTYGH